MQVRHLAERETLRMKNRIRWSLDGLRDAWVQEHTFRSWVYCNIVSIIAMFVLPLSAIERLILLALGLILLGAELLNTAIERVVDLASPDEHPLAKQAKDAGSAGVAVISIAAGLAWVWVLVGLIAGV